MRSVMKRELESLFGKATGYIVIAAILLSFSVMTYIYVLQNNTAMYSIVVVNAVFAYAVILPLYTAIGFSRDKRTHGDKLLHSLPLTGWRVVLGKFAALCVPVLAGSLISLVIPVVLSFFMKISFVQVALGMFLYILLGCFITAVSMLLSRISSNVFFNVLIGLAVAVLFYFAAWFVNLIDTAKFAGTFCLILFAVLALLIGYKATRSYTASLMCAVVVEAITLLFTRGNYAAASRCLKAVGSIIGPLDRFNAYYIGVFSVADVCYFLAAIAVVLFLCAQLWTIETQSKRRSAK